jgi:hypothetical protein
VNKGQKYCFIDVDLFSSSFNLRAETEELKKFREDFRAYLVTARKAGSKDITGSHPGGSCFYIKVLKKDLDYWVERVKKLVHLGNLQSIKEDWQLRREASQ